MKLRIARAFDRMGLNRLLLAAQRRLRPGYIRAVNYHDVPARRADAFEAQLGFYREHFEPIGLEQLERFLAGAWRPERPGLILSFDDGLRSHAEVAAPLLERYGFPGWFCVPAGFPDAATDDHDAFRAERQVSYDEGDWDEGAGVMSWDQIRALDARHVIVCHSYDHRRLGEELSEAEREREITAAKARLEEQLGHPVRAFAWVGGEEWAYCAASAEAIRRAGFEFGLMTNHAAIRPSSDPFQLQRTNIEAADPPALMRLSLSGFFDLLYWPKRRRVNRVTAATT
jgi:peptidoglycan/xylan/chitin deacetylase (PgdA/CDA1 family)